MLHDHDYCAGSPAHNGCVEDTLFLLNKLVPSVGTHFDRLGLVLKKAFMVG